ncbi:hypothetical protein K7432_001838 [Basidiobolus ranarum]|uniref:GDP-fucose protein O-fucosyltransferase 2 n=1 Tax=Basidiobolus ranarum TaxID=34480 RepID=A0ABR2X2C0_9FUNG
MRYSEKNAEGILPIVTKLKNKPFTPRVSTYPFPSYSSPNSAITLSPSTPFPGTPRISRRCTRLFILISIFLTILTLGALTRGNLSTEVHTAMPSPQTYSNAPVEEEPKVHPPFECGEDLGIPCKFIFPTFIAEQESKGIQHFWQLALLAKQLNRTIVLPNTYMSRMSTCYQFPFSHYFSDETLKAAGIPFVYMNDFYDWVGRQGDVSAQSVLFDRKSSVHATWSKRKFSKIHCLGNWSFNYDKHDRLNIYPDKGYWRTPEARARTNDYIIDTMTKSSNGFGQIDDAPTVFLIEYRLVYTFIKVESTSPPLLYHPSIKEKVDQVASSLSPFIAVHWRMETVTPYQNLPQCAENLVKALKRISEEENIKNIYLATDYPLEDEYPHSSSWDLDELTMYHHSAIRRLKSNIKLHSWITLEQERHSINPLSADVESDFDPGLLGIFDKMMCTQADYFLAGPPECSRASSFTAQIAITRESRRKNRFNNTDSYVPDYRNIMNRWEF